MDTDLSKRYECGSKKMKSAFLHLLLMFWIEIYSKDAIHNHFVTLIVKLTINFLPTHSVFLLALARDLTKLLCIHFTHFATLICPMLDPPTTIVPFADKRDKVGMDGVPKCFTISKFIIQYRTFVLFE